MMMIGAVMLAFRRPIAASSDTQRTNMPADPLLRDRLRQESAHRTLIACALLVMGGAALIVIATVS